MRAFLREHSTAFEDLLDASVPPRLALMILLAWAGSADQHPAFVLTWSLRAHLEPPLRAKLEELNASHAGLRRWSEQIPLALALLKWSGFGRALWAEREELVDHGALTPAVPEEDTPVSVQMGAEYLSTHWDLFERFSVVAQPVRPPRVPAVTRAALRLLRRARLSPSWAPGVEALLWDPTDGMAMWKHWCWSTQPFVARRPARSGDPVFPYAASLDAHRPVRGVFKEQDLVDYTRLAVRLLRGDGAAGFDERRGDRLRLLRDLAILDVDRYFRTVEPGPARRRGGETALNKQIADIVAEDLETARVRGVLTSRHFDRLLVTEKRVEAVMRKWKDLRRVAFPD